MPSASFPRPPLPWASPVLASNHSFPFLRWVIVVCLTVGLWAPQLHAESNTEDAAALFAKGEDAFRAERFEEAARLFERADAAAPHASVIYNAAVSWDQAGQLARAADGYMTALQRGGLSERDTLDAEGRLDALASQLGFVQIARPVGGLVSVGHKQQEPIPARFFLMPNDYDVLLETETGSAETPISVVAGKTLRVQLAQPVAAVEPQPRQTAPDPPPPPPIMDPPSAQSSSTQRIVGWACVGAGVVASGAAIYLGTRVNAEKARYEDSSLTPRQRNRALEDAKNLRTGTNIAWGGSALLGGAGIILVLTSPTIEF